MIRPAGLDSEHRVCREGGLSWGHSLGLAEGLLLVPLHLVQHGPRIIQLQVPVGPGLVSGLWLPPATAWGTGHGHLCSLWLPYPHARLWGEGREHLCRVQQTGDSRACVSGGRVRVPGTRGWEVLLSVCSQRNGLAHQTDVLSQWGAHNLQYLYQLQVPGEGRLLIFFFFSPRELNNSLLPWVVRDLGFLEPLSILVAMFVPIEEDYHVGIIIVPKEHLLELSFLSKLYFSIGARHICFIYNLSCSERNLNEVTEIYLFFQ